MTQKLLKIAKQVVWGGGEPTLDKSFELIVNEIDKYANQIFIIEFLPTQ